MLLTRVKNTVSSIGELDSAVPPSSLVLKLSITDRCVRYFVQSLSHEQIVFFGNYALHHVEGTDELIQRLERIVENDEVLQLSFAKVFIGIDSAYSLVPAGVGSKAEEEEYLTLNQNIEGRGMDIVFNLEQKLHDKLNSLFRNGRVMHLNSSLLVVFAQDVAVSPNKLFVNINTGFADVIRFTDSGRLQLMNRYMFKTETDFIYFILLCCQELQIDREQTELVLSGEVAVESKIYELCRRYFRHITFARQPPGIHFSIAFEAFPKHLHFNLYNLGE